MKRMSDAKEKSVVRLYTKSPKQTLRGVAKQVKASPTACYRVLKAAGVMRGRGRRKV